MPWALLALNTTSTRRLTQPCRTSTKVLHTPGSLGRKELSSTAGTSGMRRLAARCWACPCGHCSGCQLPGMLHTLVLHIHNAHCILPSPFGSPQRMNFSLSSQENQLLQPQQIFISHSFGQVSTLVQMRLVSLVGAGSRGGRNSTENQGFFQAWQLLPPPPP